MFNQPNGRSWIPTTDKIVFEDDTSRNWKSYVVEKRLEITCGEAPYLVSRYDTTTGELIPLFERIGLLDRKLRVVNENCKEKEEWIEWSIKALKSVYGYEFQGDSILLARENLLYDYIDYYREKFCQMPPVELLSEIANIIVWNIWQMDGLRCVVPYSCHEVVVQEHQNSLFDRELDNEEKTAPCHGCEKGDVFHHNGIYCKIYDWTLNKSVLFVDILKGATNERKI